MYFSKLKIVRCYSQLLTCTTICIHQPGNNSYLVHFCAFFYHKNSPSFSNNGVRRVTNIITWLAQHQTHSGVINHGICFALDPMFTIEQAGAWKSICLAQFTVLTQTQWLDRNNWLLNQSLLNQLSRLNGSTGNDHTPQNTVQFYLCLGVTCKVTNKSKWLNQQPPPFPGIQMCSKRANLDVTTERKKEHCSGTREVPAVFLLYLSLINTLVVPYFCGEHLFILYIESGWVG